MRRLLKPTRRLLRRLLIVLLALVATINAAAFLLTPLLDHYRDDLAVLASERLGRPIAIGAMRARWRGFGPELVLQNLEVGAPGQQGGIRLADVALDFGFWDMLRYRDLSPLRLTLRDLEVHLIRDGSGKLHLAGFEGLTAEGEEISRLPLGGRLRLLDVTVLWEDQRLHLPVRRLDNAQLRLHLWPDRLSMTASVNLPGSHPGKLKAGADLALAGEDWSGEIYLAGNLPEAAAQLGPYLPEPLRLRHGGIRFEVWSDWQTSRLLAMQGTLNINDLHLDRGQDSLPLELQALSTAFRYRRDGENRQIDLAELTLTREGQRWPSSDLHLGLDLSQPGLPAIQLSAQYLRLSDLLALTRPAPLPATLQTWRDNLDPHAELQQLRFQLEAGEGPARWQISTAFSGLRTNAWQHFPGVRAVQGQLQGNQQQLTLQLRATSTLFDLPELLPEPLQVSRLDGELRWQKAANGDQTFSSAQLTLDTPDIQTSTRLALLLPTDGPLDIDLQTAFQNAIGEHAARYYPVKHMNPVLVSWLKEAIHDGRVPQGSLLLRGPLQDFPFEQQRNGRFEVRFDVADLNLAYKTDWPPLLVKDAEVVFHNNALAIELREGRIYNSTVLPTQAHIRTLDPIGPLELHGEVQGPLQDQLRLLSESPIKTRFGDLVNGLQVTGDARLGLDFNLVLDTLGKEQLNGALQLQQAKLNLPAWDLALDKVNGRLAFDLDGVHARDVKAEIQGQRMQIDVSPSPLGHRITANTHVDTEAVRQQLPGLPADLVSGTAPLEIAVDIPRVRDNGPAKQVSLSSDLQGMALHLPAPLGKDAESARLLELQIPLQDSTAPLHLSYAGLLDALFRAGGDRADIRLGGGKASLPEQPVLRIGGHLEQLELDPWLKFAEQGVSGGELPPIQASVKLEQLGIGTLRFEAVRMDLQQHPDGWDGQVDSPTFAGRFQLPPRGVERPIVLDLAKLAVSLDKDAPSSPQTDPGQPADWPDLDMDVAQLTINGHDFGKLSFRARHDGGILRLSPLTLDGPLASFDGLAQWHGSGHQADSDLIGKLHSPRLGDMLAGLGYSPQFSGAALNAELTLSWPGNLGALKAATLRGQVQLEIDQGQLLEVDPGVARVFGLLNFSALQRRLRLDFSDLFRKGLTFDKISGSFRLIDGNAFTSDLAIKSPSGDILITGRTGLVARDLYQEVTVTPRFDATLPVAGALAGGPITGLALLVAQQVMKDKVDKFNQINYQVSGSWDDPKVERQSGEGGLSRILDPITGLFNKPAADSQDAENQPTH